MKHRIKVKPFKTSKGWALYDNKKKKRSMFYKDKEETLILMSFLMSR